MHTKYDLCTIFHFGETIIVILLIAMLSNKMTCPASVIIKRPVFNITLLFGQSNLQWLYPTPISACFDH